MPTFNNREHDINPPSDISSHTTYKAGRGGGLPLLLSTLNFAECVFEFET